MQEVTASISCAMHMQAQDAKGNGFKDHASHFVLRLAYCRAEELRRWFLTHESELFKARFDAEGPTAQASVQSTLQSETVVLLTLCKHAVCQLQMKKLHCCVHRCL